MAAQKTLPSVFLVVSLFAGSAEAQEPWWQVAESADDRFVTVDLTPLYYGKAIDDGLGDEHRIASTSLPPEETQIQVGGIPFVTGSRNRGDHLDIGLARWPDEFRTSGFYTHYGPRKDADPEVPVVRLPKQNYSAAWLLCMADTNPKKTPLVSLRLGLHDRNGYLYDTSVRIPRWNEDANDNVVASGEVRLTNADRENVSGRLFLIRAPLHSGDTQELRDNDHIDLELTKELHVAVRKPDPNRFRIRPLGSPSAVHVFALTLEQSPIQMKVTSPESGNIFVEPQSPVFQAHLRNITPNSRQLQVEAQVTDYYGNVRNTVVDATVAGESDATVEIPLRQNRRGWFEVTFQLREGERQLVDRRTTFAVLPPDTRQSTLEDSPFGTWYFGTAHRGSPLDKAGPLMQKAGIRHTLERNSPEEYGQYGLRLAQFSSIVGTHTVDDARRDGIRDRFNKWPHTDHALVFHESNIGPIMTHPAFLLDKRPEPLDENTQQELERRWKAAVEASQMVRELAPRIKLVFGNMTMPAVEQYLSRGYPAEYIDLLGEESPSFMRMPERQPEVAGFSSMWWLKEMARYYGYRNKGVTASFEWTYHSTNPGNNSERAASDYNVRDSLLALAYGSPHANPALIHDVGNGYYYSNWGASGLCRRPPELNPKPGYVSFATMTLMLDRARFSEKVPTGSTSVFALKFRRPDGSKITALWTIRGERDLTLSLADDAAVTITDAMANQETRQSRDGEVSLTINSTPRYVSGADVTAVTCGAARYQPGLAPGASLLTALDTLDSWDIVTARDEDYENHIWDQIQRPGRLRWETVDDTDQGSLMQVALDEEQGGPPTASYYGRLRAQNPIELPGEPKRLGMWVHGNSSWARIAFELVDAEGEAWINIGAAKDDGLADWNTNDTESTTFVNFDGWRQLSVDLPGHYGGGDYHWPRNCNWRYTGGNGRVDYPLRLTGMVVELRENLVYIDELVEATSRSLMFRDLACGDAFDAPAQ